MATDLDLAFDLRQSLTRKETCVHPALHRSESPEEAALWHDSIRLCSPQAQRDHLRWFAQNDLFFLAVYILERKHFIRNPRAAKWTFDRCREVQDDPDGYADLWPRESFKSEIVTFALTIQNILNNPEETFGLFSHTRPIAVGFLVVIKREFENNDTLKDIFDDILWREPKLDARAASVPWSDHAITVKRWGNPKEASVEAWGLTDGQPTSRRFSKMVYDDVVARDQVSVDMTIKTTGALENSFLLTAADPPIYRYLATFQEIGDTTQAAIDRRFFNLRKRGPLDDNGDVAYCSDEKFAEFKKKLSPKVFALQVLLDPSKSKDEHDIGFREEWMDYYEELPPRRAMNVYNLVDPAGASPDSNSHFAMVTVGICADKRARVLDVVWDKLDLEERWQAIFAAEQKWQPLKHAYEKFAFQSDIEHFNYRMNEVHYKFTIVAVGGTHRSKDQRIGDLLPWYRDRRFLWPRKMIKTLKDGSEVDIVKQFKEREFLLWPYTKLKDILDAQSRIADPMLAVVYPKLYGGRQWSEGAGGGELGHPEGGSWMAG